MNFSEAERGLKDRIHHLFSQKHPSKGVVVEGFDEQIERVQTLQRRMRAHRALMEARAQRKMVISKAKSAIRRAMYRLNDNATFMSFDVECVLDTSTITEIGVTMLTNGEKSAFNYRVEGVESKCSEFIHGETIVLPLPEIIERLQAHAEEADNFVGHSLYLDFDFLKDNGVRLPEKWYADTASWSAIHCESGALKLVDLAKMYGVDHSAPHCGGNDSYTTLEVMLAMVQKIGMEPKA